MEMKNSVTISSDWLAFTVACDGLSDEYGVHSSGVGDVRNICGEILRIPFENFRQENYGRHGYRMSYVYEGIRIYYDGHSIGMGANVSMSGNACRVYETHHTTMSLIKRVLKLHLAEKANITRFDAAADDRAGILSMDVIEEAARKRNFCSTISSTDFHCSQKKKNDPVGVTVYLGSAESEKRMRTYNKAVEQGLEGEHWIRVELMTRREHAVGLIQALVENEANLGGTLAKIIMDTVRYIEMDNNKSCRCSVAEWWARFLGTLERVKIMLKEKPAMSIERSAKFLTEQVSAAFYTCVKAYGLHFTRAMLDAGEKKFGKRHEVMLADFKNTKKMETFLERFRIHFGTGQLALPPASS
jgi:DNA relaxase NicK